MQLGRLSTISDSGLSTASQITTRTKHNSSVFSTIHLSLLIYATHHSIDCQLQERSGSQANRRTSSKCRLEERRVLVPELGVGVLHEVYVREDELGAPETVEHQIHGAQVGCHGHGPLGDVIRAEDDGVGHRDGAVLHLGLDPAVEVVHVLGVENVDGAGKVLHEELPGTAQVQQEEFPVVLLDAALHVQRRDALEILEILCRAHVDDVHGSDGAASAAGPVRLLLVLLGAQNGAPHCSLVIASHHVLPHVRAVLVEHAFRRCLSHLEERTQNLFINTQVPFLSLLNAWILLSFATF